MKALGADGGLLRIVYARAGGTAHVVLGCYEAEDPLILDNLSSEVLPLSQRPDLKVIFSATSKTLWIGGKEYPAQDIKAWKDVLNRMEAGL